MMYYFKFKYVFSIMFYILYFKTENSNMSSSAIEDGKNIESMFDSIIFKNNFY